MLPEAGPQTAYEVFGGVGVNFSLVVLGKQEDRANYNEGGGTWIPTSHSSDGDCKPGGAGWGRWRQAAVGLKSCFAPWYLVTISKLRIDQGRVPSQVSQPPRSLGFHT